MPQPEVRTTEQIQYEKLTSLFKSYAGYFTAFLGLLSIIMGILAGYILWTTNSDRKAMNEERKEMQTDYKLTIKELKDEIKVIKNESEESIEKINQNAENELKRVSVETKTIADIKTREELDKYFQTERIKKLISDETVKRLKGIVDFSVGENTKYFYAISNAVTQMRMGKHEGLDSLSYFSKNLPNVNDRKTASQFYNQICFEFQKIVESNSKDLLPGSTTFGSTPVMFKNAVYMEKYNIQATTINTEDEKYKRITNADIYEYLIKKINDKKTDLNTICFYIAYINYYSNNNFRAFEFDKMNKWYKVSIKSLK